MNDPEGQAWWSVRLEAAGAEPYDQALLGELLDRLAGRDAAVTGSPEEPSDDLIRYGARLSVCAAEPVEALVLARELFQSAARAIGLPSWPLHQVEVVTERDLDAELVRPAFPELYGMAELAERLGVSRQRASIVSGKPDFPRPVAVLKATPVWTAGSVARFLRAWQRRAGRPARRLA